MDEFFTTQHVCKTFKVSHQTVKNWCREFAPYLSVTATPKDGKKRVFTTADLEVFALVSEYNRRGFRYDDAHAALKSGQRGEMPEREGEIIPTVPPALLTQLREQITSRDAIIHQITTERDKERGKVEILEKQLAEKEKKIEELYIRLARLESRTAED
jgi:DNA-binding transcriptional MerR regulator